MPTVFVGFKAVHPLFQRWLLPFVPSSGHQPLADEPEPPPATARSTRRPPFYPSARPFYYTTKRLCDLLLISLALGFLLPLLLIIAIAIKVDSPGPLVVSQECIGRRRRLQAGKIEWLPTHFLLYRFRTTGPDHALTNVGHYLRWSGLEQLPQVWNMIKGDLTLIGPRPLVPPAAGAMTGEQHSLMTIPGMIWLWQSENDNTFDAEMIQQMNHKIYSPEMIRLDCMHTTKPSLRLDWQILRRTFQLFCKELMGKFTKS